MSETSDDVKRDEAVIAAEHEAGARFNANGTATNKAEWMKARLARQRTAQERFPALVAEVRELRDRYKLRPRDEWHEDDGPVIWHHLPIVEAPYIGYPLDTDFDHEYYTHWQYLPPCPTDVATAAKATPAPTQPEVSHDTH